MAEKLYLKSNIHNVSILLYIACHIPQFKMLLMPFLIEVRIAQNWLFMISGFVVYRCQGNIDFTKVTIITNFSLNPVNGKILRRFDEGKSTKNPFKNLRYGPQKTVSKHLNFCSEDDDVIIF